VSDPISFAFAQREADQEPDIVSIQESHARGQPVPVSGRDPVPRYEPESDSVACQEPDSVAERVLLDGQLPEQAVAVRLDDVGQRHCDLPLGRSACADPHLDDV